MGRRGLRFVSAILLLGLAAAACGQAKYEFLNDVRAWPAYLPQGVEVEGRCIGNYGLMITSPDERLADSNEAGVVIHLLSSVGNRNPDTLPRLFLAQVPGLSIGQSSPLEIRDIDGITWQRTADYADRMVTGIAWSEGENAFSIEGVGLNVAELKRIAESLEPSFSRWMGCL